MRTQPYNNFWQRIHKAAKADGFPLRVMFELTYRCNFYCQHCYVPESYKKKYAELRTKEVFLILDQLAEMGCFYLGFTGGEPFLRRDIIRILWYAKRKGFEVIIYTNGSLLNERMAEDLARLRPNKIDITIPAMSEGAFERITQAPGSYKKVFSAIDLLYKKRVNLGFKSCVLKENELQIKDIQKFTSSLGALHRLDDMFSRSLDGSDEPFKYRGALGADYRKPNPNEDICVNLRAISVNSHLFRCGAGISQAAITPLGELKLCLMIDYPKYKIFDTDSTGQRQKANLKSAWGKLKGLAGNIKPDENYKCNKCELQAYCKWCPARGWLEKRSFTACDPQSRSYARATKEKINAI